MLLICFTLTVHVEATTYIKHGEFYLDESTVPQGKVVVGQSGQIRPLQDGPLKDFQYAYGYDLMESSPANVLEVDEIGNWKAVNVGKATLVLYLNDSTQPFFDYINQHDITYKHDPGTIPDRPTIPIQRQFSVEVVPANSPVYRLYQPDLKVHLYTMDDNEYRVLGTRGWKQEGQAWTSNNASGTPVYRLYHPGLKVHLYTMDTNEYKVLATRGWKQEGEAYKSSGSTPVYRLYHAGIKKHLYTRDANEKNVLSTRGWKYEGVAWNVE
ncbi:hypothetical protein [Streptococcus cuniculi]|nr:hypothetical protein [Streptococcus cuniculi]